MAVIEGADAGEPVTVARVCERAGTGRNTFYAHFADIPHAERAARSLAADTLALALARAGEPPTPIERIRGVVGAWAQALLDEPVLARFALRASEDGSSIAGEVLRAHLVRLAAAAARDGALTADDEGSRIAVVMGAVEALCRFWLRTHRGDGELARRAADVVVKNLR